MAIKHWILLVTVVLAIVAAQPASAKGCRQMHESGDVFTPGCIEITRDITAVGPPIINVSLAGDQSIVIDLCGHTLTLAGTSVPVISATSADRVILRNGRLVGGRNGLDVAFFVNHVELHDVSIDSSSQQGVRIDDTLSVTLDSVDVSNTGSAGISISDSSTFTITEGSIDNAGGHGIELIDNSDGTIRGLSVTNSTNDGIFIDTTNVNGAVRAEDLLVGGGTTGMALESLVQFWVSDYRARGTAGAGLLVSNSTGGTIEDVLIGDPGDDAIFLSNSSSITLRDVRADNPQGNGLSIDSNSHNNSIFGLDVVGALLDGVLVNGHRNLLQQVTAHAPGGCAFHAGPGAVDAVFSVIFGARPAGPCSCSGTLTDPVCDEGLLTTIKEILNN